MPAISFENIVKPIEFTGDYISYIRQKVKWYNQSSGKLEDYDCPICKNKGYIASLNDDFNEVYTACECMKKRASLKAINASGMKDFINARRFDNFDCNEEWQWYIKQKCESYAQDIESREWLFMGGQSGSGKTHLCTAICGKLLDTNHSVKYVQWKMLVKELQALQFDVRYSDKIRELQEAEVLYVDDFLKTSTNEKTNRPYRPSESILGYAFEVINARVISGKRTIISSEFYISEINDFDSAIAGRIKENSAKGEFVINVSEKDGRNYRW